MSQKLKRLVSTRANYRGQVTTLYNDFGNFRDYDPLKRTNITSKLTKLREDLEKLNSEIVELNWNENEDDRY